LSDRLALAHAIEEAGIPRDAAESVATAIARFVEGSAATKADVQALGADLKAEIARTEATLRGEIAQTRAELKADVVGVRSLLASEVGRLDTRSRAAGRHREGATQRDHAAAGHADGGADRHRSGRAALLAAAGPRLKVD
jgi:hypothetical protein